MKNFLRAIRKIQPKQYVAWAALIIFMWSIVLPLHEVLWTSHRYTLSTPVRNLLGNHSVDYAHLISFKDGTYHFNPEALNKAASPTNPAVSMGRESSSGMPAYDLAADPKQGVTVYDPASQLSFSLVPDFKLMAGQQVDDHIVYPLKGLKGQVIYSPKANGLKEDLVLNEEQGDALSFTYSLNLPDSLEARQQDDGSIAIYSGDPSLFGNISFGSDADRTKVELARKKALKNNLVFTIPAPVIVQQNGDLPAKTQAHFVLKNNKVTVEAVGLKKLHYPISIDPTVVVNSASTFANGNLEDGVEIDTGNNQIKRAGLSGGSVGTWNSTNAFSTNRSGQASLAYNGYMYILGGHNGSYLSDVQYATINSNGTLGAWSATTSLPAARFAGAAVAYNGYIYFSGGHDGTVVRDETYYAKINANGTLGSWTLGNYFSTARYGLTAQAYNGYLYISGGNKGSSSSACRNSGSGFSCNDVQYAAIRGDGSMGSWSTTTYYSSPRFKGGMAAYNGTMYIVGGLGESGVLNDVQYASIASDGSLGTWAATSSFTTGRYAPAVTVSNGYLYMMGGADAANSTHYNDVQYAAINNNGTLGAWNTTTTYGTAVRYLAAVIYNGYLYKLGGISAASTYTDPVVYAKIDNAGALGNYRTTTALGTARGSHATVAYNGTLYALAGWTTTYSSDAYYATISSDGTVGTWTATTSLPVAMYSPAAVAYNGYMYLTAGQSSGGNQTITYYAPINANGTLGSWTSTSSITNGRRQPALTAYNGYLYMGGGDAHPTYYNDVQYAVVNSNGTLGSWTATTSFTTGRSAPALVPYAGKMYVYGGATNNAGASLSDVQYATINSNGTLASWTATSSMTTARSGLGGVVWNGYLYAYGGLTGVTNLASSEFAKINSDGTLGAWTATASFTTGRYAFGAAAYNGYLYVVGGYTGSYATDVQYAPINNGGPGVTGTWASGGNSFSTARYSNASIALNGYIYTMGGYADNAASPTFSYTGGQQTFTVPAGVTSVTIEAWGAQGGNASYNGLNAGALGGYAKGTVTVTPGATLYVYVGGKPDASGGNTAGGYNGGGTGYCCGVYTGPGGGASDVRIGGTALTDRVIVGGGGGGASDSSYPGGVGGGTTGGNAAIACGGTAFGGTQSAGGTGGAGAGSLGQGGNQAGGGGGGGGGYYGGAGGGTAGGCSGTGGGAGGSGYVSGTNTTMSSGVRSGNGQVAISYTVPTFYNDVQYAAINANGSIGTWTTATNALWSARSGMQITTANGYIYIIGGYNGTSYLNDVWYAKQGVNGALASDAGCGAQWCSTTAFTTIRGFSVVAVSNNRIYIVGGANTGGMLSDTQYATLNASTGAVGSWTATTSLPVARHAAAGMIYNGYIYITGGYDGTNVNNTVLYAPINSNGTIGTWAYTSSFNVPRYIHAAVAYNGYMYVYGGAGLSGLYNDTQYAPINSNGTVGNWQHTTSFSTTRAYLSSVIYNGYVYAVGGCSVSGCTTNLTDTQYAPLQAIPRKARYSKYADLGVLVSPTKVVMNYTGNSSGAYAYGNTSVGGSTSYGTISTLSGSSGAVQNAASGYTQYVWLRMTMDDGAQTVFGTDNQSTVSGFELYYNPVSAGSIQPRLRGGKMVQESSGASSLNAAPN